MARRLLLLRRIAYAMLFDLGVCDRCGKPATTAMHDGERSERYCEEHWIGSRKALVRQVVCADSEKGIAIGPEE